MVSWECSSSAEGNNAQGWRECCHATAGRENRDRSPTESRGAAQYAAGPLHGYGGPARAEERKGEIANEVEEQGSKK
eukprot:2923984-Alexandrium_andersonii.AAC.1